MPVHPQSKLFIGPAFAWFRPSLTSGLSVTLNSEYISTSEPPDPLLRNFLWPVVGTTPTGIFLGGTAQGGGITIEPEYKTVEETVDFTNVPTDIFFEEQSKTISLRTAYNGVDSITSLFELPETGISGSYTGGRNIMPYKGALLLAQSNLRNTDQTYQHLVHLELYYLVAVLPTPETWTNHNFVECKFKVLLGTDETGCYLSNTYRRWTVSIYSPNTLLTPSGGTINTDIDTPYTFSTGTFMNL